MQALVDRSSEATDTEGFVDVSTVGNKAHASILFWTMMLETKDCLAFFSSEL